MNTWAPHPAETQRGNIARSWSPRSTLQYMNDLLTTGSLDRAEFWNHFISTFWADSTLALRIKFGSTGQEEYDLPTYMLMHFFGTWQMAGAVSKMQFNVGPASEGILPAGFPFLTSSSAAIETLGLDGSLLIRQQLRTRAFFDQTGRIVQLEWHILAHNEYFLSIRAGHLMAANFPNGMGERSPFICKWGFPTSVHRLLDTLDTLKDVVWPTIVDSKTSSGQNADGITHVQKNKPARKRKKTPPPLPIAEVSTALEPSSVTAPS